MKIGLISDTHGFLDESVFRYFESCDEIWHAGDIGTVDVLEQLEKFKTTRAVFGNIDGHDLRIRTKEYLLINGPNIKFLLIHIAGKAPRYNPQVRKLIQEFKPNVLICGHSHFLKVERDIAHDLLFMNPGAAGRHGFHKVRTLLRFELADGKLENLEVIELGSRSRLD